MTGVFGPFLLFFMVFGGLRNVINGSQESLHLSSLEDLLLHSTRSFFTKERWSQLSFENQVVLANFGEGHFLSLNCSLTVLGKIFCADVIWHRFWSNWGLLFEFQEWKKFLPHQIWYVSKSLEKEPAFCFILEKKGKLPRKIYAHLLF